MFFTCGGGSGSGGKSWRRAVQEGPSHDRARAPLLSEHGDQSATRVKGALSFP